VAAETMRKFESVVSTMEEDMSGRKVVAAILLYNKNTETLSVVSLGTGKHDLNGIIKNVLEHKMHWVMV
jgi:hypothetical protein